MPQPANRAPAQTLAAHRLSKHRPPVPDRPPRAEPEPSMRRPSTFPRRPIAPLTVALACVASLPSVGRAQYRSDYSAPREATVDARGARRIDVDAHAGELRI